MPDDNDTAHASSASDTGEDEQAAIVRLMKTLRESIPYRDEDERESEPDSGFDSDSTYLPAASPPPTRREPLPSAIDRDSEFERAAHPDDSDNEFRRLLYTLRAEIPDESESDISDDLAPLQDDEDIIEEGDIEEGLETINDRPRSNDALTLTTSTDDDKIINDDDDIVDESDYPPLPDPVKDNRILPIKAGPNFESGPDTLEVSPGESAVIADILRSMHDIRPRGANTGHEDGEAAAGDEDDEEQSERGQIWKIALVLGGAATFGLAIALVNPFGDSAPLTSDQNRVVVPLLPPRMAESTPVIIPSIPEPLPEQKPEPPHRTVVANLLPPPPVAEPPPALVAPPRPVAAPIPVPPPAAEPPPPPPPPPKPVAMVEPPPPPPPPPPKPVAMVEPPPPPPPPPPKPVAMVAPPPPPPPPPPPTPKPVVVVEPPPPPPPPAPKPVVVVEPPPPPSAREPARIITPPPPPIAVASLLPAPPPTVAALKPPSPVVVPSTLPGSIETPKQAGQRFLTVQVGSFQIQDNANVMLQRLIHEGFDAYQKEWTDSNGQVWHVVRVGHLTAQTDAEGLLEQVRAKVGLRPQIKLSR
ncbi:MAG: SPOR domain-containing protein [Rhodospirillaceae bacterium]